MSMSPQQFVALLTSENGLQKGNTLLTSHRATLAPTRWPDVYIVKFDHQTESTHPEIIRLRGLIVNVKTKQILSLGHSVPIEFKDLTPSRQQEVVKDLQRTTYRIEEALDGTLLRYWYHEGGGLKGGEAPLGEWVLSTNSKEDANEAFWIHGKSFFQQFMEAYPNIQYDRLNPNYVYLFRVCHPCNVIVVNHVMPRIYHVATMDRTTCLEVPVERSDLGLDLPLEWSNPEERVSIGDVVAATAQSQSQPVGSAGWMVIQEPDREGVVTRYRFENQNYTLARGLRGESNNMTYTLLQNYHQGRIVEFLRYYPIYVTWWNLLCGQLSQLTQQLFQEYLQVFIKKTKEADPHFRGFLNDLHREGVTGGQSHTRRGRMTPEVVYSYLLKQSPERLCHLLGAPLI
jgi:hypothetical protein